MTDPNSSLRLNVGFIIHETIGFSREFPFDLPRVFIPPDLDLSHLTGIARITRTPQGLLVQVKMSAYVTAECVRCLTTFPQALNVDFSELYAFTRRSVTESGLILPEDGHIDLNPLVREYMLLEIPISPVCRPDCKGLCPECGTNLNESTCEHSSKTGDSRLTLLRALLL